MKPIFLIVPACRHWENLAAKIQGGEQLPKTRIVMRGPTSSNCRILPWTAAQYSRPRLPLAEVCGRGLRQQGILAVWGIDGLEGPLPRCTKFAAHSATEACLLGAHFPIHERDFARGHRDHSSAFPSLLTATVIASWLIPSEPVI